MPGIQLILILCYSNLPYPTPFFSKMFITVILLWSSLFKIKCNVWSMTLFFWWIFSPPLSLWQPPFYSLFLICISLNDYQSCASFHVLLTICVSFLGQCPFMFFLHFLIELFDFFVVEPLSFLWLEFQSLYKAKWNNKKNKSGVLWGRSEKENSD